MQRESAPVLVDDESTDGGEEALPFGGEDGHIADAYQHIARHRLGDRASGLIEVVAARQVEVPGQDDANAVGDAGPLHAAARRATPPVGSRDDSTEIPQRG